MGSNKGQSQSQQQQYQSQTYTPNAQAMGYIQNALGRASDTANQPFNIPQAPVAGFSQDQQGAFQQFRNAQGAAQPYYNQAANYFSPQGTQDFYNPYAANVMANMKDVFGQQMTQNDTGLTQAAGGVGADRIAVGHAALAKQQDLAAGQTMADLWQRAGAQAQSAGQGQMALGQNVQNSQLQGANSMLGVGGLQQQLTQAQMNSPYQQQLAMAAFPYQQAQFLAGITGSLAPGMGGTTAGWGNTNSQSTPAQPSIWSQLLGAGMAGAGAYGGAGGFSGNGGMNPFGSYDSYGGGNAWNSAYGGSASNPLPGLSASDYGARGGRMNAHPYAAGGSVQGYDGGGACSCPPNASAPGSDIGPYQSPPLSLPGPTPAPPNAGPPNLGGGSNRAPPVAQQFTSQMPQAPSPVQQQGNNYWNTPWAGAFGGASGPKGAAGFGLGRGSGYAEGGDVDTGMPSGKPIDISHASIIPQTQLAPIQAHIPQLNFSAPQQQQQSGGGGGINLGDIAKVAMMFANSGGRVDPYYAAGGALDDDEGPIYRMPDQPSGVNPYDTWRNDTPMTPTVGDGGPALALASDPPGAAGVRAIGKAAAHVPAADVAAGAETAGEGALPLGGQGMSPTSQPAVGRERGFADSPWAALMAAGLGMMGGTSPYAGVNIAGGGMQAMKTLQQQRENAQKDDAADMSARRLAQEAQHHLDSYGIQQQQLEISRKNADKQSWSSAGAIMTKDGLHPAVMESGSGKVIDAVTGNPPEKTDTIIPKGGSKNSPEEISNVVDGIIDGSQPPVLTGLYGDSVHVRSGLKAKGFNLAKAQVEWDAAKKQTAAVNSQRMTQYVGLNKSVDRTIDEVRDLSTQMQLGGIPFMNKLELAKYIQTQGNSEKGQLATKYMTAVNTLKEEFANLANGGYAPTEAAWKLANEQVNGNYGMKQLHASIDEIQRLIRYRIQAVPNLSTLGPGAPNRYNAPGATPPAAATPPATSAPAGGGGKPDVATRFGQIVGGGKTEEEAYKILHEEGYD